jgi:hypothetical protein
MGGDLNPDEAAPLTAKTGHAISGQVAYLKVLRLRVSAS